MYLTSFVHREELFDITERWLCNRLEPTDGLRLTQILICDGFVLGETLDTVTRLLLSKIHINDYATNSINFKGELREFICNNASVTTSRVDALLKEYRNNPEFFYVEAPINGSTCVDREGNLVGIHRIKRPRRIAEKANRYIANWIFRMVQERAQRMAEERAQRLGIPLHFLLTPEEEMEREFVLAEETIAQGFKEGRVRLDRAALTIPDVGGIKIIAGDEDLSRLEEFLQSDPTFAIVEQEKHEGDYRARKWIIDVPWDGEAVRRRYMEDRAWDRYLDRGIAENELHKGIGRLLDRTEPRISIELILSTFPDFVESELGKSIHEERIVAQRNTKVYKGYIPMNVEFLIEYLFGVGLSPRTRIDKLPVKIWGRYLPDTISYHIRQLYGQPEHDALY
ncbi:MAG TPA: hypothetical protein VMT71_08710 [Syntrophorhabdales bacterium]|nr:hypothetical protein [Syntrophorhabdales bacterium]